MFKPFLDSWAAVNWTRVFILSTVVLGCTTYFAYKRPATIKTVTRDRIIQKDVEKIVTKTVTKPSGVKIVTITEEKTKVSDRIADREITRPASDPDLIHGGTPLKWGLGLSLDPVSKFSFSSITLGRRITGPLWIEATVTKRAEALVGIRFEF